MSKNIKGINFTHKGWFYFVPIYMANIGLHEDNFTVHGRFGLNFLLPLAKYLHWFLSWLRNDYYGFLFKVTGEL